MAHPFPLFGHQLAVTPSRGLLQGLHSPASFNGTLGGPTINLTVLEYTLCIRLCVPHSTAGIEDTGSQGMVLETQTISEIHYRLYSSSTSGSSTALGTLG